MLYQALRYNEIYLGYRVTRFIKNAFHVQIYKSFITPKTALNVSLYVHSLYFNLELICLSIGSIKEILSHYCKVFFYNTNLTSISKVQ